MRRLVMLAAFALLSLAIATSAAAQTACAPFVTQALNQLNTSCTDLQRNSACYGFNNVSATFFNNAFTPEQFAKPNDRADLAALQSITTAPLDPQTSQWGIAVIKAQANLPDTLPGQAVTFLLLGDVSLKTGVEQGSDMKPMQAVYFTTGISQPKCSDPPPSALVVQGPQNVTVNLRVNGADISLGSTAIFKTSPDNSSMECGVLDGKAIVGRNKDIAIAAGFTAEVPLDNQLNTNGTWGTPQADDDAAEFGVLDQLPNGYLNYSPDIPTGDEIEILSVLDPQLVATLDPHVLRQLVRLLIAEGATKDFVSVLNVNGVRQYLAISAGNLDATEEATFTADVQATVLKALDDYLAAPPTPSATAESTPAVTAVSSG